MKTVRCISPKNYRLTRGTEYQTLQEDDNAETYTLVNNSGLTRNYRASLFEDVVEELSDEEIISSIGINEDNDITLENRGGETIVIDSLSLGIGRTPISCGIFQLTNVNGTIDRINQVIDARFPQESADFRTELKEEVFRKYVIRMTQGFAFLSLVISTNNNHPTFSLIEESLGDLSSYTHTGGNPNSGNNITFWYITKEDLMTAANDYEE
jgi:hypothetical protein